MIFKLTRTKIAAGILFLLIAFGVTAIIVHQRNNSNSISGIDTQTADYVAANGISTRADYVKTVQLRKAVTDQDNKNPLTEQEVDWLLAYANNSQFQGKAQGLRQMYASGVLMFAQLNQIPATRRQNVYNFGVELVRAPDQDGLPNSLAGCRILSNMRNKDAIPEIQPLLQSKDKETRKFAALALDRLGVDVPPSAYLDHS